MRYEESLRNRGACEGPLSGPDVEHIDLGENILFRVANFAERGSQKLLNFCTWDLVS